MSCSPCGHFADQDAVGPLRQYTACKDPDRLMLTDRPIEELSSGRFAHHRPGPSPAAGRSRPSLVRLMRVSARRVHAR